MNPWISLILGAIGGWLLDIIGKFIYNKFRERKEVKNNDNINVSGDWYAAWQTSVNRKELLNTESIIVSQRGKNVTVENRERAPENPEGGYLWKSSMQFYQGRNLMGWYFPLKSENNSSKGIMYMTYFSPQKVFIGKWAGSGFDGELESGFLVIAKTREVAKEKLEYIISKNKSPVNIISYEI